MLSPPFVRTLVGLGGGTHASRPKGQEHQNATEVALDTSSPTSSGAIAPRTGTLVVTAQVLAIVVGFIVAGSPRDVARRGDD